MVGVVGLVGVVGIVRGVGVVGVVGIVGVRKVWVVGGEYTLLNLKRYGIEWCGKK